MDLLLSSVDLLLLHGDRDRDALDLRRRGRQREVPAVEEQPVVQLDPAEAQVEVRRRRRRRRHSLVLLVLLGLRLVRRRRDAKREQQIVGGAVVV